jgi:hypothetical protein
LFVAGVEMLPYLPLIVGVLAWSIGASVIFARLAKRNGRRWPMLPSLADLSTLSLSETLLLTIFLLMAFGGFALTVVLTTP